MVMDLPKKNAPIVARSDTWIKIIIFINSIHEISVWNAWISDKEVLPFPMLIHRTAMAVLSINGYFKDTASPLKLSFILPNDVPRRALAHTRNHQRAFSLP
jgi:hypothetical protein